MIRIGVLMFMALALLCAIPASAETLAVAETEGHNAGNSNANVKRRSFAVIIGNNRSLGARRPDLHYADDDAARYFEILQTIAPGRVSLLAEFDRDTARLFPDAKKFAMPPTLGNLRRMGKQISEQVQAAAEAGYQTEVYFVFAGHGDVAAGEGFIELSDARFHASQLESWLQQVPFGRAHVILDSCNSFFMLGVRKPGGRHFVTSEDAARSLAARMPNVGVFLSTSAEGEAFEWSEIQSGIFSHVVRSGLLGAADANLDGSVSYTELAAFVDTATADVRNPNMRPHVYARGPGAVDNTPIARPSAMRGVRRFRLGDASSLRIRLRDSSGLPLLDAHTEAHGSLRFALPSAWAEGAVVERASAHAGSGLEVLARYALPAPPTVITLASLEAAHHQSAPRGPAETFRTLFAQPFGPAAVRRFIQALSHEPPPVYGVSKQDILRMQLVLDELARVERGRRLSEGVGATGFGALLVVGGASVLHAASDAPRSEQRKDYWLGGSLLTLGSLMVVGGSGSLLAPTEGEQAAVEFRKAVTSGEDTAQAFARADRRIQQMIADRASERVAGVVVGSVLLGLTTLGLVYDELQPASANQRLRDRMSWGASLVGGGLLLTDSLLADTPSETLTHIWRDDPSINQYQTSVGLVQDGAMLSVSGKF